mgnify:CR=1 FL=1
MARRILTVHLSSYVHCLIIYIQNVGLVLIGDELCVNDWILPYLHQKNASSPKFVYLVYDCPCVDGETIHQFPLGVAT